MLVIDVLDDKGKGDWLAEAMTHEIKWAVRALNRAAQKAVTDIKRDMPQRFTMRSPWAQKGIRFDRATVDSPVARVYSVDDYMWKQEHGESYKPDGHVAIPSAARPSPKALIPRNMLPNSLRGRGDVFKFDFSVKSTYKPYPLAGIFQRVMGNKRFRILYLLKDKKNTKPLWNFTPQVESAIDKYFEKYYRDVDSYDLSEVV